MDDVVNRFARELADAIAAAVAENPQVEACREKARAAGFEMKVTLEAVVGFVSRSQSAALTKVTAPARVRAAATANLRGHRQRSPLPPIAADRRRRDRGTGRIELRIQEFENLEFVRAGALGAPAFFISARSGWPLAPRPPPRRPGSPR